MMILRPVFDAEGKFVDYVPEEDKQVIDTKKPVI